MSLTSTNPRKTSMNPTLARRSLSVLVTLLMAAPGPALARSPVSESAASEASDARHEAEAAFADERYDDAAAAFERAYAVAPHPTDLFNLGRVREEQGALAAALEHYEAFAEQPRLSLAQRDAAAERIEVLRKLVQPKPDATPVPVAAPVRNTDTDTGPAKDNAGRPLIISGAVLTGVGMVTAIAGGVGVGLVARRNTDSLDRLSGGENPTRLTLAESEELHAQGRNAEALQITFLAAGSAVALAGVALLAVGIRAQRDSRRASVTPTAGAGFAGVSSQWRF